MTEACAREAASSPEWKEKVKRYFQLCVPYAVMRFLAFFARQSNNLMPGSWGRACCANLIKEFDRREQHFVREEEEIRRACLQQNLEVRAVDGSEKGAETVQDGQGGSETERASADDQVIVGLMAAVSFLVEHCSYEMIERLLGGGPNASP